ncbi:MAG: bromoperoxidase [Acidimicrobiales bacterium]
MWHMTSGPLATPLDDYLPRNRLPTRIDVECRMPYVDAPDHTRLHYTDWGEGHPVVFCHAWALTSDTWQYQIPALVAGGFRCVTYDRRGHGRSDRPGRSYDFDNLADDLAALLDHLDIDHADFVGHSFGCGEIVRYATRRGSEQMRRAVFLAPIMPNLSAAFTAEELAVNAALLRADVPAWCAENAPPFFGERHVTDWMVEWVARQIIDTPLPVLLATMAGYAVDFTDELSGFALPTLVIHGDADASAPLDHTGARVVNLLPDARLSVVAGAGHGIQIADHPTVNQQLLHFLTDEH